MAFRLAEKEVLEDGIRRIAIEQLDKIFLTIDNEKDRNEAVHDVRKRFKKLRAVVRLIRAELGEDSYKTLNTEFRDLAREIAPVRDSYVLLETLDLLKGEEELVESVKERLKEKHSHKKDEILKKEKKLFVIKDQINRFEPSVSEWEVSTNNFSSIKPGIKKVYKRGKRALKILESGKATSADYHDFRKRVKYLWYQIRILRNSWNRALKPVSKELHKLSDILGDDHDLFVLSENLKELDSLTNEEYSRLNKLIISKRKKFQKKSIKLGGLLFTEKPGSFVNRMKRYYEISN